MKNHSLQQFILQISKEQEEKNAEEKRKKYFRELGRKGGLKKKSINQFSKVVSVRFTEKEFEKISIQSNKLNLNISKYLRLLFTEKEIRINEFKTDEILLNYGNYFIRIKNLLRHREFSKLENSREILSEIEKVTNLIYDYLYNKINAEKEDE
ncbi:MAG: special sigma factor [Cloacibacterium sp.]|jgi:transcriptional regulator of heat shock response|nr:special sigma factor [Cloacibacterium sp.]